MKMGEGAGQKVEAAERTLVERGGRKERWRMGLSAK
jgi:hypothetical protein